MGKIIVFMNLTLDGVMQSPGRPDEDIRGGFKHGGWAAPYAAMTEAGDSTPNLAPCCLTAELTKTFMAIGQNKKIAPLRKRSTICRNMSPQEGLKNH